MDRCLFREVDAGRAGERDGIQSQFHALQATNCKYWSASKPLRDTTSSFQALRARRRLSPVIRRALGMYLLNESIPNLREHLQESTSKEMERNARFPDSSTWVRHLLSGYQTRCPRHERNMYTIQPRKSGTARDAPHGLKIYNATNLPRSRTSVCNRA